MENVSGDLEVNNTNGSITLTQIAGSAVAQTVNGEVKASFTKVNADKSMSFSSLNGDIDVTFPPSLKATVRLKSEQGEIYSDFDVQMQKSGPRIERDQKGGGKFRVTLEKAMQGTINRRRAGEYNSAISTGKSIYEKGADRAPQARELSPCMPLRHRVTAPAAGRPAGAIPPALRGSPVHSSRGRKTLAG